MRKPIDEAIAYLDTLADFGGTVEQARELARKGRGKVLAMVADHAKDAVRRLVDEKFSSGNAIPVERITVTRQEYEAAIAQLRKEEA